MTCVCKFLGVINCWDSDIFIEWRQSIKLVVLFLVNNIFNSNNFSFLLKNNIVLLLVSWIWILYISHTMLVGLYSIWESDPLAMEQWELQIFYVL
jgi:hypothetical protein